MDVLMVTDQRIQQIINKYGGGFKPAEFLSGRENLNVQTVEHAVRFRNWHGFSTFISSAYRENSISHRGNALDLILYRKWMSEQPEPMELWLTATTWPFYGVGIYFDWRHGENDVVGLHVDILKRADVRPLRWLRITRNNERYYFYQNRTDGTFYNRDVNETVRLDDVIEQWKQRT